MNNPLRVFARSVTSNSTTPCADALADNRARIVKVGGELAGVAELHGDALRSLAYAQAAAALPGQLRERIHTLEAELAAARELGSPVADAAELANLRSQLAAADASAAEAAHRARVEHAKLHGAKGVVGLEQQLSDLRSTLQAANARSLPLAVEFLWEKLASETAAYDRARADFLVAFDTVFSTAAAIDKLAQDTRSGRFAGSGAMTELVLPMPTGTSMRPLPYTLREHWDRLQQRATDLLHDLLYR